MLCSMYGVTLYEKKSTQTHSVTKCLTWAVKQNNGDRVVFHASQCIGRFQNIANADNSITFNLEKPKGDLRIQTKEVLFAHNNGVRQCQVNLISHQFLSLSTNYKVRKSKIQFKLQNGTWIKSIAALVLST